MIKKLNKRVENRAEKDKRLEKLIEDFDKKHASAPNPVPIQPSPVLVEPVPAPTQPPKPEIDPEARAKRIAELEIELKQVHQEEDQIQKGLTQNGTQREREVRRERHAAIRAEYNKLTKVPKPEPALTPEEAESLRKAKLSQAATERQIEEMARQ